MAIPTTGKLIVKGLPDRDWGRQLVRLNCKHRIGIARYGIAKITNTENGMSVLCIVLGHKTKNAIYMAYDIRKELELKKNGELDFELEPVGWFGRLRWYVKSPDPAVYIPAWLAVWSVILGAAGLILGIVSLCM